MPEDEIIEVAEPPGFVVLAQEISADMQKRYGIRDWTLVRRVDDDLAVLELTGPPGGRTVSDDLMEKILQHAAHTVSTAMILQVPDPDPVVADLRAAGIAVAVVAQVRDERQGLLGAFVGTSPAHVQLDPAETLPVVGLQGRIMGALLSSELLRDAALRETERTRREALRDGLTGLLNRQGWERAMRDEEARAARYGLPATVVMVDLDELKATNDLEGHRAGDKLLCTTASVMSGMHRTNDVVARIGGDEFVALLVETSEQAATTAIQRLQEELEASGVKASVGFAGRWVHGTIRAAEDAADKAMYAQKAARRQARRTAIGTAELEEQRQHRQAM